MNAAEVYLSRGPSGYEIHATHQPQESEEYYALEQKEECFVEVRFIFIRRAYPSLTTRHCIPKNVSFITTNKNQPTSECGHQSTLACLPNLEKEKVIPLSNILSTSVIFRRS